MTGDELKTLRAYYHSLVGQKAVFQTQADRRGIVIRSHPVDTLGEELGRLESELPGLVPPFDASYSIDATH
jgi:hypothetical protein